MSPNDTRGIEEPFISSRIRIGTKRGSKNMLLKWNCIRLIWKVGLSVSLLMMIMLVRVGNYLLKIEVKPLERGTANEHVYKLFTEETYAFPEATKNIQQCRLHIRDRLLNSTSFWHISEDEENVRVSSTSSWSVAGCSIYQDIAKLSLATELDILRTSRDDGGIPNDVTLATQLSHDRLDKLQHVLEYWPGPVSAAVYLDVDSINEFISFICNSTQFRERKNLGLHVVRDTRMLYPVNKLRNLALEYVSTRYAFLSDVDFVPYKNLHSLLYTKAHNNQLDSNKAYVVPAFEVSEQTPKNEVLQTIPRNKKDLLTLWGEDKVRQFHVASAPNSHFLTDYVRLKEATLPYRVNFSIGYEPYLVMEKKYVPKYDPSFLGRNLNKIEHLAEIHASGIEYWVMPDVFTVHIPHDKTGWKGFIIQRWCARQALMEFHERVKSTYNVTLW